MKYERKPPLPRSPVRIRGGRVMRPRDNRLQSTPNSSTKPEDPKGVSDVDTSTSSLHPECRSLAHEFNALEKMVSDEFGGGNPKTSLSGNWREKSMAAYERGRFFDKYSTMRNEKLKRKKMESLKEVNSPSLAVAEYSTKRGARKMEDVRKSMPASFPIEKSENPRYSLRSLNKASRNPSSGDDRDSQTALPINKKTARVYVLPKMLFFIVMDMD